MSKNLVNWKDFKIENMVIGSIQKKTSKMDTTKTYNECTLSYNYEKNIDGKIIIVNDELFIEFPEISSNGGIMIKENQSGKMEASMLCSFNLGDPDMKEFVSQGSLLEPEEQGLMGKIFFTTLDFLFKEKSKVPAFSRIPKIENMESLLTPILYWSYDEQGIIKTKNPSKFIPLINYGEPGTFKRRETLFNLPSLDKNGKPKKADWEDLKGVNVSFIPNVHFKKIYIGAKASFQTEIESAIITKIVKIGDETSQSSTIERLINSRPDIVSSVEANIAGIKNMRLNNSTSIEEDNKKPIDNNKPIDDKSIIELTTEIVINDEEEKKEDIKITRNVLNLPGLKNMSK
jgi:hypothetical protein